MKKILAITASLALFMAFQACNNAENSTTNHPSKDNIYEDRYEGGMYNMDERDTLVPIPEEEDSTIVDSLEISYPVTP